MMIVTVGGKEVHITHLMADGRVLESVKDYLTSVDQLPPITRKLLINLLQPETGEETETNG